MKKKIASAMIAAMAETDADYRGNIGRFAKISRRGKVPEHNWSGWPGAWCLDCGCDDPREIALADGSWDEDADGNPIVRVTAEQMECKEPGSGRFDPYRARQDQQDRQT